MLPNTPVIAKMCAVDVDQIEAFLAIVERGGVTQAALRLRRSQPAISRRLSLLEGELGAPLFERVSSGLRLTEVGVAFLPHAEATLAALRDGGGAARDALRVGSGVVSLAVVGTLVDGKLSSALRGLSLRSKLRLSLRTTTSQLVSSLVRRGEATLGVRYFADDDPELSAHALGSERMVVVASGLHGSRRAYDLRGLARERWLGFPSRAAPEDFGRLLRRQLAAAGLFEVEIMEVDSISAQKRLVEAGFGLALLPRTSVKEELKAGTLRVVRAPRIATSLPIVLVHRRNGYLGPGARALLARLARLWRSEPRRT